MKSVINRRNLRKAHREGKSGNGDFNCWGATLFVLDAIDELYWAENNEIAEFIENETKPIDKKDVQEGDILALYYPRSQRISHTAVYISKRKLFHKVGGCESEYTSKAGVKRRYPRSSRCGYFRCRKEQEDLFEK